MIVRAVGFVSVNIEFFLKFVKGDYYGKLEWCARGDVWMQAHCRVDTPITSNRRLYVELGSLALLYKRWEQEILKYPYGKLG